MAKTAQGKDLEAYILSHLDEAIEKGHIKVYYQPVIRAVSRQLCGLEALARWDDPVWGLLPPEDFISILEKNRQIHHLDTSMIRQVCAAYREHAVTQGAPLPVSINLSRLDYELCDIFEVVETAVKAHNVPRQALCIEITESALNDQASLMRYYIERFRGAGYQVWMDDFGSGYSSLNVLKDYQFDELKIDMAFLSDFHSRSKEILTSIVHMAKEIHIQTLVEGVETEEQFEFLRNIGCEKVQGFLFGKPLPYLDCIRQVQEQGVPIEPPVYRKYYDDLGRLNVLSATPFRSTLDKKDFITGRDRNSVPLAVLELRSGEVRLLFSNDAFDETVSALDWSMIFGASRNFLVQQDTLPLDKLSGHLIRLLEEARASGTGKMYFVDKDEYYEMQAKRIAEYNDTSSILVSLVNLSRSAEINRQDMLDEGLRQVYNIYDHILLLNLKENTARALYMDSKEDQPAPLESLAYTLERYAQESVFPADRQRFLSFTSPETLEDRVSRSGGGYVCTYLRTRLYHGNFIWKRYIILRVRMQVFFLMVQDAGEEIRELQSILNQEPSGDPRVLSAALNAASAAGGRPAEKSPFTPAMLWENFQRSSALKVFWKDKNRRFQGASQSFLDFYGFHSLNDILNKTDEDIGWHLHPDLFRNDEWGVIRNGIPTRDVLGTCIARGENRNIIASKMPIYDDNGQICGLLGYFSETEPLELQKEYDRLPRHDALTGLLNVRGLEETLYAYQDEYELREQDYAHLRITIEDFPEVNRQYGYDFGDILIRAVSNAVISCCGNTAAVGRVRGPHFAVLFQFESRGELDEMVRKLREIPSNIHSVGGVPFTPYLSVEVSVYSESKETAEDSGFRKEA